MVFRIPDDVIRALGQGDNGRGLAVLCDTLGIHPMAGSPGTVSAATLREIGHGDITAGRRVLQKLIARVRNTQKPATGIVIQGSRANVFVSVDKQ
jgi:hypothetical protein